jgi:predicted nucleic acid-binding protein
MRSMSGSAAKFFLDTNVLVYANDHAYPDKQAQAGDLISRAFETRRGCVSTQVLNEFFWIATRKLGLSSENARAQVVQLRKLDTVIVDPELIVSAIDLHIIHRISFWDALIVKGAVVAGCRRLYTEDLNAGQIIDGVEIVNPFI